jgi:hypothetical protein
MFVPVDQGHGWGFRYFHTAWIALPVLAAAGAADTDMRPFVVGCALLTLAFGVGFRAWQIYNFVGHQLAQVPAYAGTERRIVILNPTFGYYSGDLVQNDPWLRETEVRMITRGSQEDEAMMREHFPAMHRVYEDKYGAVWSAAAVYLHDRRGHRPK